MNASKRDAENTNRSFQLSLRTLFLLTAGVCVVSAFVPYIPFSLVLKFLFGVYAFCSSTFVVILVAALCYVAARPHRPAVLLVPLAMFIFLVVFSMFVPFY